MKEKNIFAAWPPRAALWLFLLLTCGCAVPVPEGSELGKFISDKEIVAVTLVREGLSYFAQSRFMDAELRFRQALYLYPELPNLKTNLAVALVKQGQFEEADELYRELLNKEPDSVALLSGLAALYVTQERFEEALNYYERAWDKALIDPNRAANIARTIANLEFRLADEEAALCYSLSAATLKPVREEYEKHLKLLIGGGHYQRALALISEWSSEQDLLAKDPNMLHQRAMAAFGADNLKQALSFEQLALANLNLDPAVQAEMQLLKGLVIRLLIDRGVVPPDPKLEESSEREAFLERLRSAALGNRTPTLYWPANLVAEVDLRAGVAGDGDDLVRGGV